MDHTITDRVLISRMETVLGVRRAGSPMTSRTVCRVPSVEVVEAVEAAVVDVVLPEEATGVDVKGGRSVSRGNSKLSMERATTVAGRATSSSSAPGQGRRPTSRRYQPGRPMSW